MLTRLEVESGVALPIGAIFLFGFGVGLGMAPLTDTVMAAVPVNDAGVGSAVNDVSRELGGALGVAIVGAIVSGLYRSNVEDTLAGAAPDAVLETAGEGIGVAVVSLASLPPDLAITVERAADAAFVSAVTDGLIVCVLIVALAALIAALLIPWSMRPEQAAERWLQPELATASTGVVALSGPLGSASEPASEAPAAERYLCRCYGYDFNPWCRCAG